MIMECLSEKSAIIQEMADKAYSLIDHFLDHGTFLRQGILKSYNQ